ncbi:MAG: ATP-binding protein, partial [Prolixibacteraceae bacterium]
SAPPHFITLTGYGNEQIAAEMMKLGSHEYIIKEPNFFEVLPGVLKHVCLHVHNKQQLAEARKHLKKNLELLKETGEMARVGSWEIDLQSNIVYWTDTTKKIHEVPDDYLPTLEEAINFFPGEAKIKIKKAVEEAINKGNSYDIELQFITAKGNKLWVHVIGKPEMKDGKCVGLRGTFQDITKRKEAEENLKAANQQLTASEQKLKAGNQQFIAINQQLKANEQQLRAANQQLKANEQQLRAANQQLKAHEQELLLAKEKIEINEERYRKAQEIGHIGSWEYNLQTETFWGSEEGKKIYNLNREKDEFSVQEIMKCVITQDRERVNQAMVDLLVENKTYDIVFTIIPKNTSERKIIRSIAELEKNESNEPIRVLGVLHDITLQKTFEKKLIVAKEKAEQADQLKSAFLANMSHEIRTPMNGILGFTNLLKDHNLSAEKHSTFIGIIQKSGNRMLETVNALIDISKIETGQVEVSKEMVDINKELMMQYSFFKPEASQKGLELFVEKQLDENFAMINTDKRKLNSIFTNLIKNAIKYTDNGFVKIGLERENEYLQFYIKDSGIGIPKNRQKAIFNRFEQADIKDTRAFQGSGLGLAITKAYVELLGGEIKVDSAEGKGSTFRVQLPLSDAESKKEIQEKNVSQPSDSELKNLKVLIAEDDKISEQHLSILLNKCSREILYSVTGRETIELCKKHPDTDLILMDVKMPDINGYDATKEIRKFNNTVIIIAQTAYAMTGEREKALAVGCDEYISKPIDAKELFRLIEKTVKEKKSL